MREIIFSQTAQGDVEAMRNARTNSSNPMILTAELFPLLEDKAKTLIRYAPAYSEINGTLMTAEKKASLADTLKLYRKRQKRGAETCR